MYIYIDPFSKLISFRRVCP